MPEEATKSNVVPIDPSVTLDLLDPKERAALEAVHGPVVAVKTLAGVFAFRIARRQEYDRYNSLLFNEKTRPKAGEALCLMCVVWPNQAAFNAGVDRFPAIVTTCANPLLEHCGLDTEAAVGKSGSGLAGT